jgi:hypothetical protein
MSTESPRLVTTGTVNGTPIQADVRTLGNAVKIQLLQDYQMLCPDSPVCQGFPQRPSMTGAAPGSLDYPRTITSGTTLTVLQCEANALIAANAATLAA